MNTCLQPSANHAKGVFDSALIIHHVLLGKDVQDVSINGQRNSFCHLQYPGDIPI